MRSTRRLLRLLVLSLAPLVFLYLFFASPTAGPPILDFKKPVHKSQSIFSLEPTSRPNNDTLNRERADAVKAAFQFAWDGYSKHCFGQDEINTLNNNCTNTRNRWGASAVDAFSTALVMELQHIVTDILAFIPTIDFSKTDTEVSLFETTIRYMAGMLSGYDLLKGPLAHMASNASAVDALLVQSKNLADAMAFAFETPTGIPANDIFITNQTTRGLKTNGLATAGSLILEWTRLSDHLGDKKYEALTEKAESYLLEPKPPFSEPFPGLEGTRILIENGSFLDAKGGWGASDDSFYEYLIKMYIYDANRFSAYKDRWVLAADSSIKHLASHPSSRPNITFLAFFNNKTLIDASEHLACFDGGNFLLGGQALGKQQYIDFGLALVDGCHETYNNTVTGIGPERFSWKTPSKNSTRRAFFDRAGFYITDRGYDLRPEVIESFYYAYRITGGSSHLRLW